MSRVNRKHQSCGHRNFGDYCHRCKFADRLEALAQSGKFYVDHKKAKNPHKWTKEEMLAEVKRLRNENRGRIG